jgi:hypothetical protein
VFGPSNVISTQIVVLSQVTGQVTGNVVLQDNIFSDVVLSQDGIRLSGRGVNSFVIERNTFDNIRIESTSACVRANTAIPYHEGWGGTIQDNTFTDCFAQGGANAIYATEDVTITGNRFTETAPDPYGMPAVTVTNHAVLRNNLFDHTGHALRGYAVAADAIWNWWGDPSGPYHAMQNPGGLGDTIEGNVNFDPWYTDSSLSVPGLGKPLPHEFVFEAYPNPFNSTVTLNLIPPEVMMVRVELFDVLGRKVKDIWSGPLGFQKQIVFDGNQLASGIYFARVWQPIGNRTVALKKLMLLK